MPLNLERARQLMQKAGVDAIVAASPANVFYVSDYYTEGVHLGCGTQSYALLPLDGEPAIIAPRSEADLVIQSGSWIKDIHFYGCLNVKASKIDQSSDITKKIAEAVGGDAKVTSCDSLVIAVTRRGLSGKKIAFDSSGVNPIRFDNLKKNLPDAKILDSSQLISNIRAVKSSTEVGLIERVTEITEKSMEDALEIAQPEIMEIDMAGMFSYSIAEDGGRVSHEYIGFGERSAYPNPVPTALQAVKGNLIRMKLGATLKRYHGNVVRTALLGGASSEVERRLKSVIDAQEAAFDIMKPGTKLSDVFTAIQKELAKAGLKECSSSLGHCIGIDCYEWPWITSNEDAEVEEGMVLNISSPYLDLGWGGIELEDTVQVTKKGVKLLTNTERTLYLL